MTHPAAAPLAKAEAAIDRYRIAPDLDGAEDAWCDYLHNWVRAVNKYDAFGRQSVGAAWNKLSKNLRSDRRLTYIWEARNSDEHSIAPIVERSPPIALINPIAVDMGDGLVVGPGGEVGISLGEGLSLSFSPGDLHLVTIHDRNGTTYTPPLQGGTAMSPLKLMEFGRDFLKRVIPSH